MSSNSTYTPGAGPDFNDFYSRSNTGSSARPGTVVPGMDRVAPKVQEQNGGVVKPAQPVVGFLYSVSRQGFGEFWPLHVGSNTIGRSAACDICLNEGTVSEKHASLNIKQLSTTKKLVAAIRDEGSKTGIFVNDEELGFDMHPVQDKDIITIGKNYTLVAILIDAEKYGLKVAEEFIPTDAAATAAPEMDMDGMFGRRGSTDAPSDMYNSSNRVENGTVAMDGSADVPPTSRTKFL